MSKTRLSKEGQIVESQVEKLIAEIDHEISQVENLQKPRQITVENSREITTAQLESILRVLRFDNRDKEGVTALIRKLDENGDGKISLDDIYAISKEIEEKEGCGVLREQLDNGKK